MRQRRPNALVLFQPLFLGALVVLVANDHWAKDRWPGFVTGKMSDFAGPIVVAFAIAAVSGNRRLAIATTTCGFAALKLSPPVAVLAAPILGGVTRTDPTDLIGLLALIPAWLVLRRNDPATDELGRPTLSGPESEPLGESGHRPVGRLKTVCLIAIGLVTVFAVTATSCDDNNSGVVGLFPFEGGLVAQIADDSGEPYAYWVSRDGGLVWERLDLADVPAGGGLDPDSVRFDELVQDSEVCRTDGRCFRATEGELIQERFDGDWEPSFRFTEEQVERMMARADGCSGADRTDRFFSALAVVESGDGPPGSQVVVAAMGPQGIIRLDQSTGEWQRVGVGFQQPLSTFGPTWLFRLIFVPLLAFVATPMLLVIGRKRNVPADRRATAVAINIVGSLGVFAMMGTVLLLTFGGADYAAVGLTSLVLSVAGFLIAIVVVLPAGSSLSAAPGQPPPPR